MTPAIFFRSSIQRLFVREQVRPKNRTLWHPTRERSISRAEFINDYRESPVCQEHSEPLESRCHWCLHTTVSKTTVRSSSANTARFPVFTEREISLCTFNSADSMLCRDLKPKCKWSRTEFNFKNVCNWIKTFSQTLERKSKWGTGRKLDSTEGSRFMEGPDHKMFQCSWKRLRADSGIYKNLHTWPKRTKNLLQKISRDDV